MAQHDARDRVQPATKTLLSGAQVVLTGRLASMTHEQAAELIGSFGGEVVRRPSRRTKLVVVGQEGWLAPDGSVTESLQQAERLRDDGYGVKIVSEQQFLELLGLSGGDDDEQLFTTTQLARILRIPGHRIRAWIRRGLIQPAKVVHRLSYFDFAQVASIRTLDRLITDGIGAGKLRDSLEQIRAWHPGAEVSLSQLARLDDQPLLVRLEDGTLAEPSGQLRMRFDGDAPQPTEAPSIAEHRNRGSDEDPIDTLIEAGLHAEERGELEAAAGHYEEALRAGGPGAELAFNLGNVLHALDRPQEALTRFKQATEHDPLYVEAWNNLASVLAQLERFDEAIATGREALKVTPDFPDAHFNLAQIHKARGEIEEARHHALAYLELDSRSEWAQRLRDDLGLDEPRGES